MRYPKKFYYTDRQNSIVYRRQPTPSLKFDINRMLKGLPCWIDDSSTSKEKNKKLIVADWTAFSWSNDKIKRIIKELNALILEGFQVYIWQAGEILCLEPGNMEKILEDEEQRIKMLPHDLSSIREVAGTNYKIKADELLILDDYWIYYLLHQNKGPQKRCLSFYKVMLLIASDLNIPITFFSKLISQSQPELDTIILDDINYSRQDSTLKQLSQLFPKAKILESIRSFNYREHDIKSDVQLDHMHELKYLTAEIQCPLDLNKFTQELSKSACLKKMRISTLTNIPTETPICLSELYELDLTVSTITSDDFKSLTKILPNLKKVTFPNKINLERIKLLLDGMKDIEISHLNITSEWLKNLPKHLEYLKKFSTSQILFYDFGQKPITTNQVSAILQAFSKTIKIIEFNYNNVIKESSFSSPLPFFLPLLKQLILSHTSIDDGFFSTLINSTPNLQHLILIKTNLSITSISARLDRLKMIHLEACNINTSIILQNLIEKAPNLEELKFISNIKETKSLTPNKKSHLKILKLEKDFSNNAVPTLNIDDINAICEAFPALETLDLKDIDFDLPNLYSDRSKTIIRNPLKYLKEITYSSFYTDTPSNKPNMLIIISYLAPNLESLSLELCDIGSSKPPQNLFPFLRSLTLNSQLDDDICLAYDLEVCFGIAPDIAIFNFEGIDIIYNSFSTIKAGCLPYLRECNFSDTKISRTNLEMLYQAAPLLNREMTEKKLKIYKEDLPAPSTRVIQDGVTDISYEFNSQRDMQIIDADTGHKTKLYNVIHIFSSLNDQKVIHPSSYRLDVFQSTETNPKPCKIKDAFFQKKEGDLELFTMDFSTEPANYEGIQELILKSNKWVALASLSPLERMVGYNTLKDVEIKYSYRDNLYYIRQKPKPDGNYDMLLKVNIQFRLHVPIDSPCPEDIRDYTKLFAAFTEGELYFDDEDSVHTGKDYLNAIITQRKGACRHRAFAFTHHYKDKFPIRIITNECHAFIEIKVKGNWIQCDLGGYPADVQIKMPSAPINQDNKNNHSPLFDQFLSSLQRVGKSATVELSVDDYFRDCLKAPDKKLLIECRDANNVDAMHYGLWSYCLRNEHQIFYIHSPDDLACSADYMIQNTDGRGVIHKGLGGPLYDFLKHARKQDKPSPILMVNYANFTSQDLACFNSLIDDKRKVNGTEVPDDILIIGLIDQYNRDTVPGPDFYSRFGNNRGICPISSEDLISFIPKLPAPKSLENTETYHVINLYHAPDWEQRLLGQWRPTPDGGWVYEEGELQKALRESKAIEIQNGLWQNKEFCRFWQEASLLRYIKRDQCDIKLPTKLTINQSEGYNWSSFKDHLSLQISLSKISKILNPSTVNDFFTHNEIQGSRLTQVPGLIEQEATTNQSKTLRVYLTRTVSDDIWAMLFAESKKHGVTLRIFFAKDTTFPHIFGNDPHDQIHAELSVIEETQSIYSTESDTTLFQIKQKYPKAIIIDISECSASDLLFKIERQEGSPFSFKKTPCALINLLEQVKTIILKGRFSDEFRNGLDPFLFERLKQTSAQGRLILLSEEESIFPYLAEQKHIVSEADKRKALGEVWESLIPYLATEPLAKLKTRKDFIATYRKDFIATYIGVSSDATYDGLTCLSASQKDPGDNLEIVNAKNFQQCRILQVKAILSQSPYVFLTGLSGVGKTTFVTKVLHQTGISNLYYGESGLLAWALDESPDLIKYLFWDEDNLSSSDRTQFEGLYDNKHHGILIQGQYHLLTDKHKMIFAGNPLNIGGERKLASFFERHGQALVFEPMPSSVLYHDLLLPLFNGTRLTKNTQLIICTELLNHYRFLCQNSHAELLISPRELQMMALLTIAHCQKLKIDCNIDEVVTAYYFGYQISQTLVPSALLPTFQEKFYKSKLPRPAIPELQDFYVTSSRIDPLNILHTILSLRESRQNTTRFFNESQRSGGLGGVILEGAPGQGKSEMVLALLHTRGYATRNLQKRYYHLPASMSATTKEELLLRAFNEGAVVVIDEINCFPINERLLNALLMGITLDGQKAAYPGFMIIGTQNPITLAGRNQFSNAIYRRLLKIELPNYSHDEMLEIIAHKGMLSQNAAELISAHRALKTQQPAFREVLSIARAYQEELIPVITTLKTGDFTAIDSLIQAGKYLRIDLIHYYLDELDITDVTTKEYENLVYLFASSQSIKELQALFTEIQKDEDFTESLNFIIRKHHEIKFEELEQARVFEENPGLKSKYVQKLATNISATLIDPWFCNSTIKIKKLMDEKKLSFRQAWLYANHYDDIIRRMLRSYLHYPTVALMLAPLLGCTQRYAEKIFDVAKDRAKLRAIDIFLDNTPQFFSSRGIIRQRERILRDEDNLSYFNP